MTEALEIGTDPEQAADPLRPYLDAEALVQAAKTSGCDSVHPGYGFLSENPAFAELCASEELTFIGPSPAVLRLFGDKVRAPTARAVPGHPDHRAGSDGDHPLGSRSWGNWPTVSGIR